MLTAIFFDDQLDDEMEWVINWKKFVAEVRGVPLPDDIDDDENKNLAQDIIEETIEKFVEGRKFASKAIKLREESANA